MANITAEMVKQLREKSGAGMMDCKSALNENDGDMEKAIDWLRQKGIAKADKKSDRAALEGLVGFATENNKAALVEINAETDFVARNENFQSLVRDIAKCALASDGTVEGLLGSDLSGVKVSESITQAIATIGENISLRRVALLEVSQGVVASYMHNASGEGLGKIGVLVALESVGEKEALLAIGKQIAMHVAATNPLAATKDDIGEDVVEREKQIFIASAKESGKPDNIIEKMVEGRIKKFYQENVLLSQNFVIDTEKTVQQALEAAEKSVGSPIKLKSFVRIQLGEGLEKKQEDFAAEVAAMQKNDE